MFINGQSIPQISHYRTNDIGGDHRRSERLCRTSFDPFLESERFADCPFAAVDFVGFCDRIFCRETELVIEKILI